MLKTQVKKARKDWESFLGKMVKKEIDEFERLKSERIKDEEKLKRLVRHQKSRLVLYLIYFLIILIVLVISYIFKK